MVEVNLNPETPSAAIIKAANTTATVTDARGRKITISKMKALDRLRLYEVVGNENAKNEAYMGYASLVSHVVSIDDEPVAKPVNKMQLEALVQRLDDDGLNAIARGLLDNFAPVDNEKENEAVKNG